MNLPNKQSFEDVLKAFWSRLTTNVKSLWEKDRAFLFVFGALIAAVKVVFFMMNYLSYKSAAEVNSTNKEDIALKAQENKENDQANTLVQQANALPKQEIPVDANWDKEKK